MSSSTCILLLGSDLGNRKKNLQQAIEWIEKEVGVLKKVGEITETEAVGFVSEQDFLNQLIEVETPLSPIQLLTSVKQIESKMGRKYTQPEEGELYTSRVIDIDILYYNNICYKSNSLNIPHYQTNNREFVIKMLEFFCKKDK